MVSLTVNDIDRMNIASLRAMEKGAYIRVADQAKNTSAILQAPGHLVMGLIIATAQESAIALGLNELGEPSFQVEHQGKKLFSIP
jgi:hypothetical protein